MHWIDIVLLAIAAGLALHGLITGLTRGLFDIAGLVLGYVVALRCGASLSLPPLLGFMLVFVAVVVGTSLAGRLLAKAIHHSPLGFADRILGACLGLLKAYLLGFVFVLAVGYVARGTGAIEQARYAPWVYRTGMALSRHLPAQWHQWIMRARPPGQVIEHVPPARLSPGRRYA